LEGESATSVNAGEAADCFSFTLFYILVTTWRHSFGFGDKERTGAQVSQLFNIELDYVDLLTHLLLLINNANTHIYIASFGMF
jgi:hypothetical protein